MHVYDLGVLFRWSIKLLQSIDKINDSILCLRCSYSLACHYCNRLLLMMKVFHNVHVVCSTELVSIIPQGILVVII